jgi:hypothetical protein
LTFEAEDRVVDYHADTDTFAVEYVAIHDRPPLDERPPRKAALVGQR